MTQDAREARLLPVWRFLFLHEAGASCDTCVGGLSFGVGRSRGHPHQSVNRGLTSDTWDSQALSCFITLCADVLSSIYKEHLLLL